MSFREDAWPAFWSSGRDAPAPAKPHQGQRRPAQIRGTPRVRPSPFLPRCRRPSRGREYAFLAAVIGGRPYVADGEVPAPLSKPVKGKPVNGLAYALAQAGKFKRVSLGAGIGIVATALWQSKHPGEHPLGVNFGVLLALGAGAGVTAERVLHYLLGWFIDPILRYLRAAWEGLLELWTLHRFSRRGMISEEETRKLETTIAKRVSAGRSRPTENRPRRYRARRPPPQQQSEPQEPPDSSDPVDPAA